MIKLIASDVDGTLIEESTRDMYPEIIEEIRRLKTEGILFCGASGRQLPSLKKVFSEVENDICFIAENGAHIHYKGKDIALTAMKREYAEEIIRQLRALGEGYEIVVSTPEGSLLETKNEKFIDLIENGYRNKFRIVEDILKEDVSILKIAVYYPEDITELGKNVLIPAWEDRVKTCLAGAYWVDFMDKSVDKGNAIRRVQEIFGISFEETMAFGDNNNDIGLVQAAKFSYAVENARPEVIEAAEYTCPPWQEKGVWQIISKVKGDKE